MKIYRHRGFDYAVDPGCVAWFDSERSRIGHNPTHIGVGLLAGFGFESEEALKRYSF